MAIFLVVVFNNVVKMYVVYNKLFSFVGYEDVRGGDLGLSAGFMWCVLGRFSFVFEEVLFGYKYF